MGSITFSGVRLVALRAQHLQRLGVLDLVQAVDAGLDRQPLQQVRQPARADGRQDGRSQKIFGRLSIH